MLPSIKLCILQTLSVVTALVASLCGVGFFTLVGLDMFQETQMSGMFEAYICVVIFGGTSVIAFSILRACVRHHKHTAIGGYISI